MEQPSYEAPVTQRGRTSPLMIALIVLGSCAVVGLGVVAILAAVLFPVFAQARDAARRATCMSNVKQLVLTHISGRYTDEEVVAEARKTFPNTRLAMDFDHIVV